MACIFQCQRRGKSQGCTQSIDLPQDSNQNISELGYPKLLCPKAVEHITYQQGEYLLKPSGRPSADLDASTLQTLHAAPPPTLQINGLHSFSAVNLSLEV